jgi:hypothetical protein
VVHRSRCTRSDLLLLTLRPETFCAAERGEPALQAGLAV